LDREVRIDMEPVGKVIKTVYPRGELHFEQEWARHGFTVIANGTLANPQISITARLLYTLLLRRAFGKGQAFPGQKTLARELGVGRTSVWKYLKELEENKWIKIVRQGLGKPNIYYLNFLPDFKADVQAGKQPDVHTLEH
jgi:hypothetical protein